MAFDPLQLQQLFGMGGVNAAPPVAPAPVPTTTRVSPMGMVNLPQAAPPAPLTVPGLDAASKGFVDTPWGRTKAKLSEMGDAFMGKFDLSKRTPQELNLAKMLAAGGMALGGPDSIGGRLGASVMGMAQSAAAARPMANITQGVAPVSTVKPADNKLGIASSLTPDPDEGMTSFSVKPGLDGKSRYTITGTGDYGRFFKEPSLPTEDTRGVAAPAADLAAAMSVLSPEQQNQIFNARLQATQERRLGVGDAIKQHIDIMNALKGPGVHSTIAGKDGMYYNITADNTVVPTGVAVPKAYREISGWRGSQMETGLLDPNDGTYSKLFSGVPLTDTSARDARLLDLDMRRTAAIDKVITEAAQTLDKATRYEETLRGGKKRTRYRTVPSTYVGAYNQRLYNLGSPVRFAKFDIKKSQLGNNSWWLGDDDATSVVFQANTDDPPAVQAERAAAAIMETFGADYNTAMRVIQNMQTSKERKKK